MGKNWILKDWLMPNIIMKNKYYRIQAVTINIAMQTTCKMPILRWPQERREKEQASNCSIANTMKMSSESFNSKICWPKVHRSNSKFYRFPKIDSWIIFLMRLQWWCSIVSTPIFLEMSWLSFRQKIMSF